MFNQSNVKVQWIWVCAIFSNKMAGNLKFNAPKKYDLFNVYEKRSSWNIWIVVFVFRIAFALHTKTSNVQIKHAQSAVRKLYVSSYLIDTALII